MAKTFETPRGELLDLEDGDLDELRDALDEAWQTLDQWQKAHDEIEAVVDRREKEEN